MNGPVHITNHGRTTHVLVNADAFDAMKVTGSMPSVAEDSAAAMALADWVEEAVILCSTDLRIHFANRHVAALTGRRVALADTPVLFDTIPEMRNSLFETHVRRTLAGGEATSADLPSPFFPDAWLRLHTLRVGPQLAVMFRDITSEVMRDRLADTKAAILDAMTAHGGVDYARLSVRGTIDKVNQGFCTHVGLAEERLIGHPLSNLLTLRDRPLLRDALEDVLRGTPDLRLSCTMIANDGAKLPVRIALVRLHGSYGCEGAVALFTHDAL